MNETIDTLRALVRSRDEDSSTSIDAPTYASLTFMLSENKIAHLEQTNQELRVQLAESQHKADSVICAHEQKHQCESLYAQGRIYDAAQSLLEMQNTINESVRTNKFVVDWLSGEFRRRAWNRASNRCHQNLRNDVLKYC